MDLKDELICDLFAALVDNDECGGCWMVEEFGPRIIALGIDVGDIGKDVTFEHIRLEHSLYLQCSRPDYPYSPLNAKEYGEKERTLRELARAMGWGECPIVKRDQSVTSGPHGGRIIGTTGEWG